MKSIYLFINDLYSAIGEGFAFFSAVLTPCGMRVPAQEGGDFGGTSPQKSSCEMDGFCLKIGSKYTVSLFKNGNELVPCSGICIVEEPLQVLTTSSLREAFAALVSSVGVFFISEE